MLSRAGVALRRGAAATQALCPRAVLHRCLNLHEFQSKDLMESFGVTVQRGRHAETAAAAKAAAAEIKADVPDAELIVKAQIHAGGRGKGTFSNGFKGGVQIVDTPEAVEENAAQMLGNTLITHQTGPEGQECGKVLINQGINILEEKYFAILMDREFNGPVMVASHKGGMDIEEVAESDPDAIVKVPVDIEHGIRDHEAERIAEALRFPPELMEQATHNIRCLYNLFIDTDATQVEINPLAVADDGKVYAVDAKFNFDDNASFRQKKVFALRDKSMEDSRDVAAEEAGLNYIGLDGNIGCMVNGAGLAMATMDMIKLHGGDPANFLDVGGGATADQVAAAFKILVSDPQVQAIMVNIFGGIMKCDTIAEGIVQAHRQVGLEVPLVVRLEGTNVAAGREIMEKSGLPIITAEDLDDASIKAVASVA